MSKQVLDISQMQHLKELGVDTSKASAYWHRVVRMNTNEVVTNWFVSFSEPSPCLATMKVESIKTYTLQDILDLLPEEIEKDNKNYYLEVFRDPQRYFVSYYWLDNLLIALGEVEFIDAAYKMLCWCIENGYVKTNKL